MTSGSNIRGSSMTNFSRDLLCLIWEHPGQTARQLGGRLGYWDDGAKKKSLCQRLATLSNTGFIMYSARRGGWVICSPASVLQSLARPPRKDDEWTRVVADVVLPAAGDDSPQSCVEKARHLLDVTASAATPIQPPELIAEHTGTAARAARCAAMPLRAVGPYIRPGALDASTLPSRSFDLS